MRSYINSERDKYQEQSQEIVQWCVQGKRVDHSLLVFRQRKEIL
jgi:hypothetical protein